MNFMESSFRNRAAAHEPRLPVLPFFQVFGTMDAPGGKKGAPDGARAAGARAKGRPTGPEGHMR